MRRVETLGVILVALGFSACDQPQVPARPVPYEYTLSGTDTVFHWPASSLPVRFYAEPVGRLPQYVEDGVRAWQRQFLYGELTRTMVADSNDADVIVVMDGPPPPDAPLTDDPINLVCGGLTLLAPRETDAGGQTRFTGPLHVYVRPFPGADSTDAQNCLAVVTMHELGHALGLLRHSDAAYDLMYSEPEVRLPSLRDQSTVQKLYHLPTDILPWRPGAAATVAPGAGETLP